MIDDVNSRVPAPRVHAEVRHRSKSGNGRKKQGSSRRQGSFKTMGGIPICHEGKK